MLCLTQKCPKNAEAANFIVFWSKMITLGAWFTLKSISMDHSGRMSFLQNLRIFATVQENHAEDNQGEYVFGIPYHRVDQYDIGLKNPTLGSSGF